MAGFLPDSDCMIATISAWHVHHLRATAEIDRRLSNGESLYIAAPALLETYAVLTRLPRTYQLRPQDCLALLEASFLDNAESVIALGVDQYINLVRSVATDGVGGRQVFDAVIAACARAANVSTLLTFNERHFRRYADPSLAIVVPSIDSLNE